MRGDNRVAGAVTSPRPVVIRPDRMTWALFSLLMAGLLLLGAYLLVPKLTAPRAEWVQTIPQMVATEGGVVPVEWIVRLRVGDETIEARFLSEREATYMEQATR
jgi:hypothetical protein